MFSYRKFLIPSILSEAAILLMITAYAAQKLSSSFEVILWFQINLEIIET